MDRKDIFVVLTVGLILVFAAVLSGCSNSDASGEAISAAAPSATGKIYADSNPRGASVYIDNNVYKGLSPVTITAQVGSHKLVYKKSGYMDFTTTVTVSKGRTTFFTANLTPVQNNTNSTGNYTGNYTGPTGNQTGNYTGPTGNQTGNYTGNTTAPSSNYGRIYASSTPSAAGVYVDNSYKGLSPLTVYNVTVGNHTVLFNKTGYYAVTKYAVVYMNQTTNVYANMTAIPLSNYTGTGNSSNQTILAR